LDELCQGCADTSASQGCADTIKFTQGVERKTSKMEADKWEELDLRAASAIRLCLAKNVLANVQNLSSAKEL